MIFGIPWIYVLFLLVGAVMIIVGIIGRIIECIRCTEEVEAVCERVEITKKYLNNRITKMKRPVWRFVYDGRYRLVKDKNSNNVINYRVGERCTLIVNPNNPEQFYRKNASSNIVTIIAGVICTAAVIGAILFERAI